MFWKGSKHPWKELRSSWAVWVELGQKGQEGLTRWWWPQTDVLQNPEEGSLSDPTESK